jgi:hypothetical protein
MLNLNSASLLEKAIVNVISIPQKKNKLNVTSILNNVPAFYIKSSLSITACDSNVSEPKRKRGRPKKINPQTVTVQEHVTHNEKEQKDIIIPEATSYYIDGFNKRFQKQLQLLTQPLEAEVVPDGEVRIFVNALEDDFHKSSPFDLHFKDTSIFTQRFLKRYRAALGTPEAFMKMPASKQRAHHKDLMSLMEEETNWKSLIKKTTHQNHYISELFAEELREFTSKMDAYFKVLEVNNAHKDRKLPVTKITVFLDSYIQYIVAKQPPFLPKSYSDKQRFEDASAVARDIEVDIIFYNLVRICMKKATDSVFNSKSRGLKPYSDQVLSEPFLFVKRTDISYDMQKNLVMYLTNRWLEKIYSRGSQGGDIPEPIDMNKFMDIFHRDNRADLSGRSWYQDLHGVVLLILDLALASKFFISVHNERKHGSSGIETNKIYGLKHKISLSIPLSSHIPQIVKPKRILNSERAATLAAPPNQGASSVFVTPAALESLNVAHSKCFRINEVFLVMLYELYNDSGSGTRYFKLPKQRCFLTAREYEDKVASFKELARNTGYNSLQLEMYHRIITAFNNNSHIRFHKISRHKVTAEACAITSVEQNAHYQMHVEMTKLNAWKNKRQLLLTSLTIAELMRNFPIYYTHRLDFRLRMYPWQYLISRTSGMLKHLMMDYSGEALNDKGLICLLQAYYAIDLDATAKFKKKFTAIEQTGEALFQSVKEYFNSNRLNLSVYDKEISYFLLLEWQITKVLSNGRKTRVHINVEIDQNASGMVFLALVLQNKALASQCNLLASEAQDVYTFVNSGVKDFIIGKKIPPTEKRLKKGSLSAEEPKEAIVVTTENAKLFLEFFSNRKPTKMALMCFCYNQTHKGRCDDWRDSWLEIMGEPPSEVDYRMLSYFSVHYENFLDGLFPKLTRQRRLLNDILQIGLQGGVKDVVLRTLDGCMITWDYYDATSKKKSYYNPWTAKHTSYRDYVTQFDEEGVKLRSYTKHASSFMPHFIHSIDAAVMRIIILRMKKRHNYVINHLHDCVLIHPNYVEGFYDIVCELFCSGELSNMSYKLFFEHFTPLINSHDRPRAEKLQQAFEEIADDFKVTTDNFEPRNMYSFEG